MKCVVAVHGNIAQTSGVFNRVMKKSRRFPQIRIFAETTTNNMFNLKKFSTFADLCNNDNRNVNRFFDSFKMTAILLCDPNDKAFINSVNKIYGELSKETGKVLLVITFTGAGNSIPFIGAFARRSLGMSEEEILDLQVALTEDATIDPMNLSELAQQFHVDVKQLPVIVLTKNIKSKQALIIPTNPKDVEDQLVLLKYHVNKRDFHGSLEEINLARFAPHTELVDFKRRIVDMLTDVMNRIELKWSPDDEKAIKWNKKAVEENVQRLNDLVKGDYTEEDWENELMELVCNRIAPIAHSQDPNSQISYPFWISEKKMVGSEKDTLTMLNTYNLFSTLLDVNGEIQQSNPDNHRRPYDYSALSVLLGKMFEKELNWSIVQQMRQCIEIPMPQYFCKYCKSKDGLVELGDKRADLNQCENNYKKPWKPLPIGNAKMAYTILKESPQRPNCPPLALLDPESVKLWGKLQGGRNEAAHHSLVSREVFIKNYELFCRFLDEGFFSQLVRIKRQLKKGAGWGMSFYS